ncbi:hypothetical protein GCM10025795_53000 [Verticiella sediminum]
MEITPDRVVKVFSQGAHKSSRFHHELEALRRLRGVDGIPVLLSYAPTGRRITTARLPGTSLDVAQAVPDAVFLRLRVLVEDMLYCGVARHSLPARDIIVRPDGTVSVVDFERCTLRRWRFGPIWRISCRVARFNLLRLIEAHAPHLLTPQEQTTLRRQHRWRAAFHRHRHWFHRL